MISIIVNKRLKKNWYVKFLRNEKRYQLNIPQVLEFSSQEIKNALFEWVNIVTDSAIKYNTLLKVKRKELEQKINNFINENYNDKSSANKVPYQKWNTKGCKYDLKEVFDSLNQRFFNNSINSFLRWGKGSSRTSYQKRFKLTDGSFYNLITIAGIYNKPDVPQFAIESIMFHEMLHIYIPPTKKNGRNVIHGPEFKRIESSFPYYNLWKKWLREYKQ